MKFKCAISSLAVLVFFLFSSISYCQGVKNQNVSAQKPKVTQQGDHGGPTGGSGVIADLYAKSLESFYINKEFSPGKVILKNGDVLTDRNLRYNIYTQQMQFVKANDTMAFGDPTEIQSLEFLSKVFVHKPFMRPDKEVDVDYFEALYEGKIKLLLRRVVTHELKAKGPQGEMEEAYLIVKQYYLQKDNKPAKLLLLNKKSVLKAMDGHADQVKKFIKDNKLNCHKELDLVKIVEYYDSLK